MPDQAVLCYSCTGRLQDDLAEIAALAGEVLTTVAQLSRMGDGGRSGDRHPLPVNLGAAARGAVIAHTVTMIARRVAEQRRIVVTTQPGTAGPGCKTRVCRHESCYTVRRSQLVDPVERAATWLATQLGWIRRHRAAADWARRIHHAAADLVRLVDRPAVRWWAGPCDADLADGTKCTRDLYALPGAETITCPACTAGHAAAKRREWLLRAAEDTLAHPELIAQALTALGEPDMTAGRIRGMARHGRIVARGHRPGRLDADGKPIQHPLYRVGDVLDVAHEQAARDAARLAAAAAKQHARASKSAA